MSVNKYGRDALENKQVDLSIVYPGIRHRNWKKLFDSIEASIGDYTYEVIAVGPPGVHGITDNRFLHIVDYGAPARAAQIGVEEATGKYMTWASDDGVFLPNALKAALDMAKELPKEDIIIMRYSEGGNSPDLSYWKAWTHADLRLPGVDPEYCIAPVGLYNLDHFKYLGGWDCRFEHLNMCCHDLAFRAQSLGSKVHASPLEVLKCDWDIHHPEWQPVGRAYRENDLPLWNKMYGAPLENRSALIDFDNWKHAPEKWNKRFM